MVLPHSSNVHRVSPVETSPASEYLPGVQTVHVPGMVPVLQYLPTVHALAQFVDIVILINCNNNSIINNSFIVTIFIIIIIMIITLLVGLMLLL